MAIEFDEEVVHGIHDLYSTTLGAIPFGDGFTAPISEVVGSPKFFDDPPPFLPSYVDAYVDLHRLLEEIRFEVALASLLIEDRRTKLKRGVLDPSEDPPSAGTDPHGVDRPPAALHARAAQSPRALLIPVRANQRQPRPR